MNSIEPLESRIAPAVAADLVAGLLSITGDQNGNTVTITEQAVPGSYLVAGLTSGDNVFANVLSISANLRDGIDTLIFNGDAAVGTVLAKTLFVTAKDTLNVDINANVNIKGAVTIEHGGGGPGVPPPLTLDIIGAGITVGQLGVTDGRGNSTINVKDGARIMKSVGIDSGGGDGNDIANFDGAIVGGAIFKTDAGDGSDQFTINNSIVGGIVTYNASSDSPLFTVQSNSTVKGPINLIYSGAGASTVTLAGFFGSLNVTALGGNETVNLGGASVHGKVTLKLGDGINTVNYGGSDTSGSLTVTGGLGSTSVNLTTGADIFGLLSVTAPLSTSATLSLDGATIGGKMTLLGGVGADGLTVVSSTVTGGIVVTLGAGANNVLLDTVSTFAGVTLVAGADADTITAANLEIRGLFTATLGNGANSAAVGGSVGGVKLTGGIDNDTFELRNLFVRGATTVTGGLGSDGLKVANGLFGGAFTFNAGNGDNTFDVERAFNDNNAIGTVFYGALTYKGGIDSDTVFLGLDANDRAITLGVAKFTGGAGINTLNDDFLIALAAFSAPGFTIV